MYDLESFSCNSHNGGYLKDIIIHQNNICGFDCCIGSHASHCDSDISSGEYRCIIDTITNKTKLFFLTEFSEKCFNLIYLIPRKEICVDFIDSKAFCYCFTDIFSVTGKHNCLFDTALFELRDRTFGFRFDRIRNYDGPEEFFFSRQIYDRTRDCAWLIFHAFFFHQLCISGIDNSSVDLCLDSVAGDFFSLFHPVHRQLTKLRFFVRFLECC